MSFATFDFVPHPADHIRVNSGYFRNAFDDPEQIVAQARAIIDGRSRYDTMVGMGLSGSIIIPRLADALGKRFLIVRKGTERSHASVPAEGSLGRRWIFVDDFISTGTTLRNVRSVVDQLTAARGFDTKLVGAYLYQVEQFLNGTEAQSRANGI